MFVIITHVTMFQHTAARRRLGCCGVAARTSNNVSTHSRPKAAGTWVCLPLQRIVVSTHSRPKAAGVVSKHLVQPYAMFQHTAARRRLELKQLLMPVIAVFQHTAARRRLAKVVLNYLILKSFNTQPPEGGWKLVWIPISTE